MDIGRGKDKVENTLRAVINQVEVVWEWQIIKSLAKMLIEEKQNISKIVSALLEKFLLEENQRLKIEKKRGNS